jgi:hypothetical protein
MRRKNDNQEYTKSEQDDKGLVFGLIDIKIEAWKGLGKRGS